MLQQSLNILGTKIPPKVLIFLAKAKMAFQLFPIILGFPLLIAAALKAYGLIMGSLPVSSFLASMLAGAGRTQVTLNIVYANSSNMPWFGPFPKNMDINFSLLICENPWVIL